jgi:hypothetical protein
MRRIQRVASGALVPTPVAADASHSIPNLLLQWKELKTPLTAQVFEKPATQPNIPTLYRLTVTRDAEGRVILLGPLQSRFCHL